MIQLCPVLNMINSKESWGGGLCCLLCWANTKQQYQALVISLAFLKNKKYDQKNPNTPKILWFADITSFALRDTECFESHQFLGRNEW